MTAQVSPLAQPLDGAGENSARWAPGYVLVGMLLGLPVAYPDVPLYWAAFAVLAVALFTVPLSRFNRQPVMVLLVLALCAVASLSNLLSPYDYVREPARFVVTSFFYLFFLAGLLAQDHAREVLAGLAAVILLQAVAVLGAAVFLFSWQAGLLNWTVPELRMWGQAWFPDWPNLYAILLCTGFLLFLLEYRRPLPAAVCAAAALLTTSRSVLVAFAVGLAWMAAASPARHRALRLLVLAAVTAVVLGGVAALVAGSDRFDEFMMRMSLMSDRGEILDSQVALFKAHPWFGIGGVRLDESVGHTGYASFHNSLGEILVRHGALGFLVYAALVFAFVGRARWRDPACAIVVFALVTSLFQNTLRHPHFFMMYSLFAALAVGRRQP